MTANVPWSVNAVEPDTWATAREAARRAGLSVGEWLEAAIRGSASGREISRAPNYPRGDIDQLQDQLNDISERLDHLMRTQHLRGRSELRDEHSDSRLLHSVEELGDRIDALIEDVRSNDQSAPYQIKTAIDCLDSRMETLFSQARAAAPSRDPEIECKLSEIAREIENNSRRIDHENTRYPASQRASSIAELDAAIAEITARQAALDDDGYNRDLDRKLAAIDARFGFAPREVQLTGIEHQIKSFAEEMQAFRRTADQSDSIDNLRNEISNLARMLGDLTPRHSIEALERTVVSLGQRIDSFAFAEMHQNVSEVINALQEIRGTLIEAKPAESFSAVEHHLQELSSKLDGLNENSVASTTIESLQSQTTEIRTLRHEVSNLARMFGDLTPRHSIEALERTVANLEKRIDSVAFAEMHQNVSEVINALQEIRGALIEAKPAESFSAVEHSLHELSSKLDGLNENSVASTMIEWLQSQTTEIRDLLSNALSGDALNTLVSQVETLVQRLEHSPLPNEAAVMDVVQSLERRIDSIARHVEMTQEPSTSPVFDVIKTRLERIEAALDHRSPRGLETAMKSLMEKLSAAEGRLAGLGSIEKGLNDLFGQMQEVRASAMTVAELAMRASGRETPSPTQTLNPIPKEAVQLPSVQPSRPNAMEFAERLMGASGREMPPPVRTAEIPGWHSPLEPKLTFNSIREELARCPSALPPIAPLLRVEPRSIASDPETASVTSARDQGDYPLEPGSGSPRGKPIQSASERVAISEAALAGLTRPQDPPALATDYIAAARRAAHAAAQQSVTPEKPRMKPSASALMLFSGHKRALILGSLLVGITFGAIRFGGLVSMIPFFQSAKPVPVVVPAPSGPDKISPEDNLAPNNFAPEKIEPEKQSALPSKEDLTVAGNPGPKMVPPNVTMTLIAKPDIGPDMTSSIKTQDTMSAPAQNTKVAPRPMTSIQTGGLPAGIGTQALRTAALAGDPVAAYEIGSRYFDGNGVTTSTAEAKRWFEIAQVGGSVPAAYRLGNIFEKGIGTTKNLIEASRYYMLAADHGNVKAMHNLAVLYSEGIDGKPDYKTAARWFRMAADRNVKDSQYNLGVLYARGSGVERNLAESFRWFSLAAGQGDVDAAKKRDDVGKRLDQQTLIAARLAVQTWNAIPLDETANEPRLKADWLTAEPAASRKRASNNNLRT